MIDEIYVEANVEFSFLSQGLLSWLCKQHGICKQSIKGNKGKYDFKVKEKWIVSKDIARCKCLHLLVLRWKQGEKRVEEC